jgi:xylulokinase
MSALTIGLDLGSSGTKAVLFDADTGVLATATRPVDQYSDQIGWSEAQPTQWWDNTCALIPELLDLAGCGARDVAAIATSGMVPAVLLLDAQGTPLRRAILQNDARAVVEIESLARELDSLDLVELTGSALTQQSVAPTLMWLMGHESPTWPAVHQVMGSYDWLACQLGAEPHVEWNWALESGMFDLRTRKPVQAVLAGAGVADELLPPVVDPGHQIGQISAVAAAATGLVPGTPVVAGGADHVLSAYAAGLARPGDWLVKLGGAGDILAVTQEIFVDSRLYLDAHPAPGVWLPNGCMATSGAIIRWYRELVGNPDIATLESEAAQASPAEVIMLPYFLGEKSPLHDPDLRGAMIGLHLGSTRGDIYRAILESIAYGFRHHMEIFRDRGVPLADARVSNGGSRSTVWKQILADALGVELSPIYDHPGASLGAAMAAAVGVGLIDDWASAASHVTRAPAVTPDQRHTQRYDEAYQVYRSLGSAVTDLSHQLARRNS